MQRPELDYGDNGTRQVNDTTTRTAGAGSYVNDAGWGPVECITDTVFDTASCEVIAGDKPISGQTYPAGFVIRSVFTQMKLSSGAVQMSIRTPAL